MEFKIIVLSRHKGPIDQYIADLQNIDRVSPGAAEMHILRNFDGVDIVFHAEGYDPEVYSELKRHVSYIMKAVRIPPGAEAMGMF